MKPSLRLFFFIGGLFITWTIISWTKNYSAVRTSHIKNSNDTIEGPFIDSLKIGIPGQFKIEIKQVLYLGENSFVHFKLFYKNKSGWTKIQSYDAQKDPISPLDVIFSDYNGDGLKDLSFRSAIAARGANEIRSLFIFNKNHLDTVKNATDFPNLQYNKELKCIDSWMVHGGCTTVFLKLRNDSLIEFASVNIYDTLLTVSEVNPKGIDTIILKRRILPDEDFTRFKNYRPLKPCDGQ
jgi:hypothetical protein